MTKRMAECYATTLLRNIQEPQFAVRTPGEEQSIENLVQALQTLGCDVVRDHLYLHVSREPTENVKEG